MSRLSGAASRTVDVLKGDPSGTDDSPWQHLREINNPEAPRRFRASPALLLKDSHHDLKRRPRHKRHWCVFSRIHPQTNPQPEPGSQRSFPASFRLAGKSGIESDPRNDLAIRPDQAIRDPIVITRSKLEENLLAARCHIVRIVGKLGAGRPDRQALKFNRSPHTPADRRLFFRTHASAKNHGPFLRAGRLPSRTPENKLPGLYSLWR